MTVYNREALPHNLDAEKAVLGAVILNNHAFQDVESHVQPGDFFLDIHNIIYTAILDLFGQGEPADELTIANAIEEELRPAGGSYLSNLLRYVVSDQNVIAYAKIVGNLAATRRIIIAGHAVAGLGMGRPEISDYANEALSALLTATAESTKERKPQAIGRAAQELATRIEENLPSLSTGLSQLDSMTGGLLPGTLTIVGARPSIGKTALLLQICRNVCRAVSKKEHEKKQAVLFFSLEMSVPQVTGRVISGEAHIPASKLREVGASGKLLPPEWDRYMNAVNLVAGWPLYFDDNSAIGLPHILSTVRRYKAQGYDIAAIFIDYIGIMAKAEAETEAKAIGIITAGLKALAKEECVPVLAASQINRQGANKKPSLSDLKSSGNLEDDADVVYLLHRETRASEYLELEVGKSRFGVTGDLALKFDGQYQNIFVEETE